MWNWMDLPYTKFFELNWKMYFSCLEQFLLKEILDI